MAAQGDHACHQRRHTCQGDGHADADGHGPVHPPGGAQSPECIGGGGCEHAHQNHQHYAEEEVHQLLPGGGQQKQDLHDKQDAHKGKAGIAPGADMEHAALLGCPPGPWQPPGVETKLQQGHEGNGQPDGRREKRDGGAERVQRAGVHPPEEKYQLEYGQGQRGQHTRQEIAAHGRADVFHLGHRVRLQWDGVALVCIEDLHLSPPDRRGPPGLGAVVRKDLLALRGARVKGGCLGEVGDSEMESGWFHGPVAPEGAGDGIDHPALRRHVL